MIVYFQLLKNVSTKQVSFYSILFKGDGLNEFEKFSKKVFKDHKVEIEILNDTIKEIGLRGAKSYYFDKSEKGAFALPSVPIKVKKANKKDFGIRLYCLFISETIVVLLNGDIKTKSKAQDCGNVAKYFGHAVKLNQKMSKAKADDFVRYKPQEIEFDNDYYIDL